MLPPPPPPAVTAVAPTFTASYSGSGRWATRYHSTPPNPGGAPDTNDAHDASTQAWHLRYGGVLRLAGGMVSATRGDERIAVSIDHRHVDGLYAYDDAALRCRIRGAAVSPLRPSAQITAVRRGSRLVLAVGSPLGAALLALPAECAGQTDPMDGLENDYGTPGFEFGSREESRWLVGRVVVPLARLRSARRLRIRITSGHPARCRPPEPSYERCTTGGRWSGVLTLTRRS